MGDCLLTAFGSAGDPAADTRAHVDWLVDDSNLRRPEDEAHLRNGLRRAVLPA